MALRTEAINGHTWSYPVFYMGHHAIGDLAVVGTVQIVVIDVELGVGIGLACSVEGDGDELSPRTRLKTESRREPSSLKISFTTS